MKHGDEIQFEDAGGSALLGLIAKMFLLWKLILFFPFLLWEKQVLNRTC